MLRHSVRSPHTLMWLVKEKMLKPTDPIYIHVGWELPIISHAAEKEKKNPFKDTNPSKDTLYSEDPLHSI